MGPDFFTGSPQPFEMPGRSCFLQVDGRVFHTYSQYARGLEMHGRLVLLPRPDRARPAGGLGGAEGPQRRRAGRRAGLRLVVHPSGVRLLGHRTATIGGTDTDRGSRPMPRPPFKGVINLDVRDSTPDWEPFLPPRAPADAPNVLIVLYDDTGLAAWSPFGGRIKMPTLQRLADNGLTYSQWHTTALCSPTRSCFLTGRNHHQNGMACITEGADRLPGRQRAHPAGVRHAGRGDAARPAGAPSGSARTTTSRSTTCTPAAPRRRWPLHQGWDRFYGFLGGETNQWYPDPHRRQPHDRAAVPAGGGLPPLQGPGRPGDPDDPRRQGDRAVAAVVHVVLPRRQPRAAPRRRRSGPTSTRAQFDDGYEAYREWVLPRMIEKGILPEGTELTADEPDAGRHVLADRRRAAVGRRSPPTRSGSSRGWPRSTPASPSTPTTRSAGSSTTSRRPVSSRTR